jgi:Cof subfamily protein (haloacid dehalogenase superfamily)
LRYKLLAIDLDGTTVQHDNVISPRVLSAVRAAQAAGVQVVIATGRNIPGVRHFAERMGLSGLMLAQQGGMIYDTRNDAILRHLRLPNAIACELVAFERERPNWRTVVYDNGLLFVTNEAYFSRRTGLVGWAPTTVTDLCAHLDGRDPDKILFMLDEHETAGVLAYMTEFIGARATVVQSHAQFVEVNPLGADKGAGLGWLCAHLGIAREDVMAIGDQHNDSTMLTWAGFSVAMGNARPEIQALADWVAPPVDQDGAAVAIERFLLTDGGPQTADGG